MHLIKPAVRQKIEDHGLSIEDVEAVLAAPQQQVPGYAGRLVSIARRQISSPCGNGARSRPARNCNRVPDEPSRQVLAGG